MKHTEQTFTVPTDAPAERLDFFLSAVANTSRSQVQKWIRRQAVMVNNAVARKNGQLLSPGDTIVIDRSKLYEEVKETLAPLDRELLSRVEIAHEDATCLVINKPAGLVTHPQEDWLTADELTRTVSVSGWVLTRFSELFGVGEYRNRPGIVHRLDKETSGLMVIAKDQATFAALKAQFKAGQVVKKYYALVHGTGLPAHGEIDFRLRLGQNGRMAAVPKADVVHLKNVKTALEGKPARTEFSVEQTFAAYTLLNVRTHTGRTHQIRVHLFAYNHPLVGDTIYINKKLQHKRDRDLDRLFLHAYYLEFTNGAGKLVRVRVDLPQELQTFLDSLT